MRITSRKAAKMKVVALVSGGKDSCYAMMEAVRFGHEVVCLAHLTPPPELSPEASEIDSFMYQSVGHNVVALIAEAMELPLVTGTITGSAITTDIDYRVTIDGDEVEDLFRLLEDVLRQHPEVEGVCTGAIFSSYQRNRVENVCSRLGLTSLGYLWRRDQQELLAEMIDSGIEAIVIKVASIGLQPRKHLGRTIADLQMDFMQLNDKYQLNVCGEGGEYETMTLDCPLFKKRIVIDSSRVVLHSDDYFAPVAFMVVEQCHLEAKAPPSPSMLASKLPSADLFPIAGSQHHTRPAVQQAASTLASLPPSHRELIPVAGSFRDQLHLSGIACHIKDGDSRELSLADEIADIFRQVQDALELEAMTMEDVCFVHLYVQDMAAFGQINAEYCHYFGQYMPPSRSCVEVATLAPHRVLMDCLAIRGSGVNKLRTQRVMRDVLHVKSISAWAPHCIGPYSQANILHRSLILLAGQISLFPQTMAVVGTDHTSQTKQSFVNAGRALEALESNLRHVCSAVIYTTAGAGDTDMEAVRAASRSELLENAGLVDVYEQVEDSDESDEEVDKQEERIALVKSAPLLVIQVSHLPRSALVEVELQALTHKAFKYLRPSSAGFTGKSHDGVEYHCERATITGAMCLVMTSAKVVVGGDDNTSTLNDRSTEKLAIALWNTIQTSLADAELPWDRAFHLRVFYVATTFASELGIATALTKTFPRNHRKGGSHSYPMPAVTFVPVEAIQGGAQLAIQVLAQDLDKLETELWLRKQI